MPNTNGKNADLTEAIDSKMLADTDQERLNYLNETFCRFATKT